LSRDVPLAALFAEEPLRWGLRGDPHLWREMRARFAAVPMPASAAELEARVAEAFRALTGRSLEEPGPFRVPRLDHGGMSGGGVSPEWWREDAMRILRERYAARADHGGTPACRS
jgi:hypothetical protein